MHPIGVVFAFPSSLLIRKLRQRFSQLFQLFAAEPQVLSVCSDGVDILKRINNANMLLIRILMLGFE